MSSTSGRRPILAAALMVAAAAGVATAHGLYQVATAARVPTAVAWLYPVITDGLALVAYAATARLAHTGRRYAAGIVILAAGLSGLAQAVYLAGGIATSGAAPVGLRFGVGAWPAIAAALTAHLLHLISTDDQHAAGEAAIAPTGQVEERPTADLPGTAPAYNPPSNPSNTPASNRASNPGVQPRPIPPPVQPATEPSPYNPTPGLNTEPTVRGRRSAADRARVAAEAHRGEHGALPTVTELAHLADVARGTAATALKTLREDPPTLHLITNPPQNRTQQGPTTIRPTTRPPTSTPTTHHHAKTTHHHAKTTQQPLTTRSKPPRTKTEHTHAS